MTSNKIAICLWIYHTKLWDEFLHLFKPLAPYIKIYIGLCKNNNSTINSSIINSLITSEIEHKAYFFPNYGADITSFIYQLKDIEEEIFIKLHAKKSSLGAYAQINWRAVHLHSLICDINQIIENKKLLNDKIGLLCNKNFIFYDQEYTNKENIYTLCNLLNIPYEKLKVKSFSAGTMFMSHTQIFKKYILPYTDTINAMLSQEQKKVNDYNHGRYAHSMERIFGYIIEINNQYIGSCHPLPAFAKIENDKSPTGHFNIIKLYNNDCYVNEEINIYGKILYIDTNYFIIQWKHRSDKPIQKYIILDNNKAVKYV